MHIRWNLVGTSSALEEDPLYKFPRKRILAPGGMCRRRHPGAARRQIPIAILHRHARCAHLSPDVPPIPIGRLSLNYPILFPPHFITAHASLRALAVPSRRYGRGDIPRAEGLGAGFASLNVVAHSAIVNHHGSYIADLLQIWISNLSTITVVIGHDKEVLIRPGNLSRNISLKMHRLGSTRMEKQQVAWHSLVSVILHNSYADTGVLTPVPSKSFYSRTYPAGSLGLALDLSHRQPSPRFNIKSFWAHINSIKSDSTVPTILNFDSTVAETPVDKCELFADYFSTVFSDTAVAILTCDFGWNFTIPPCSISPTDVEKRLKALDATKGGD
ncbi:hypothetical protein J6590_032782 [Homalodisca vitripennis]|nr:hypothetical protein J6590_032782 [Homalodisca vitripennis]